MGGFRPIPTGGPTDLSAAALAYSNPSVPVTGQPSSYELIPSSTQAALPAIAPRPPYPYAQDPFGGSIPTSGLESGEQGMFEGRMASGPFMPAGTHYRGGDLPPHLHQMSGTGDIGPSVSGYSMPQSHYIAHSLANIQAPAGSEFVQAKQGVPEYQPGPPHSAIPHTEDVYANPRAETEQLGQLSVTDQGGAGLLGENNTQPIRQVFHHHRTYAGPTSYPSTAQNIADPAGAVHASAPCVGLRHDQSSLSRLSYQPSIGALPVKTEPVEVTPFTSQSSWEPRSSTPGFVGGEAEDIETDDDFELDFPPEFVAAETDLFSSRRDDLGLLVALQARQGEATARTFTTFLNEPNILATYRPSPVASPLMDPKTARIFCHFVTVTGPSMAIYERHPANPSVLFTGTPVPISQRGLWTYTLPMLALNHQPLMHAILALASLHIAKLQGTTIIASLKHYHMALRRVAKYVSIQDKRSEVSTLAATLLLGFWEVISAEHAKWNSHLLGARQLIVETDFAGMTKRIKENKAERDRTRRGSVSIGADGRPVFHPNKARRLDSDAYLDLYQEVDENLVSLFMGRSVRYDEYGQVVEESPRREAPQPKNQIRVRDVEDYEIRRDLFWWFARQDVYQSILSGGGLLWVPSPQLRRFGFQLIILSHDYDRWSHCPPRAPIGRADASYGSVDHLLLILARIADFAARDQRRKMRVMTGQGARSQPPPGADPAHPHGSSPQGPGLAQVKPASHQPAMPSYHSSHSTQQPPMFLGMVPPTTPRHMPSAFTSGGNTSPVSSSSEDTSLEAATTAAETEWHEILKALHVFEKCLGPAFQPLSPELAKPMPTPFGTAVFYKTYSISCMWAMYNMAHIILHRSHPSMPAISMAAAGIAAQRTARYANEIGRIAGGLALSGSDSQINPHLGAALVECAMPMFFAGVQYRDHAQRVWLASRLRNIGYLTGWVSIATMAAGCEKAWERAAQMGRGPPYVRELNLEAADERLSGRSTIAGKPPVDSNDRRFIGINSGARLTWAIGLLGVEEDLEHLHVGDVE